MNIPSQMTFFSELSRVKEFLVNSKFVKPYVEEQKAIDYFETLSISVEVLMNLDCYQAMQVIEILWHLFKEELMPVYSLVKMDGVDRKWISKEVQEIFVEAKKLTQLRRNKNKAQQKNHGKNKK